MRINLSGKDGVLLCTLVHLRLLQQVGAVKGNEKKVLPHQNGKRKGNFEFVSLSGRFEWGNALSVCQSPNGLLTGLHNQVLSYGISGVDG